MENEQELGRKIYSMRSIWVGTFLGGPLTAGYLIAENFKTLGRKDKVEPTWIIAIIATVLIFAGAFIIPNADKIPRQIIPLIYSAIAYYLVYTIQGNKIESYISNTGKVFSVWRTLGIGLIWGVLTFTPILLYVYLTDPTLTAKTKVYGQLKHEVFFTRKVTESEADKIANALTTSDFFDNEQQKVILLQKKGENYIISIPLIKDAWKDLDAVNYFYKLRINIQTFFPDNRIIINLTSEENIAQAKKVLE